jgi:hypothetical protein
MPFSADAEITPYIERVDRLGLAGLWENRPRVFEAIADMAGQFEHVVMSAVNPLDSAVAPNIRVPSLRRECDWFLRHRWQEVRTTVRERPALQKSDAVSNFIQTRMHDPPTLTNAENFSIQENVMKKISMINRASARPG